MATTGALPTAPLGIGSDEQARQEYFDALDKSMKALEARVNAGPNLWNVAGQFFNPGRTGTFGEAMGNVATSVGRDIERQQEMQIPLAQMRAQLAGQKYETTNDVKALGMIANALGVDPSTAGRDLSSGNLPANISGKITPELFLAVSTLSPKRGEALAKAAGMETDRAKLMVEIAKGGVDINKLRAEYGDAFIQGLPPFIQEVLLGKKPAGATTTTMTSGTETTTGGGTGGGGARTTATTTGGGDGAEGDDLRNLPLKTQAGIKEERVKTSDKPYVEKIDALLQLDPSKTNRSIAETKELIGIANRSPQVFGLLQKGGWIDAALVAAEKGATTPKGNIGLPAEDFVAVKNLGKEEREDLRRASQILGSQFLANVASTRKLLGNNPTDNDARLLQAPMASKSDTAASIIYWGQHHILNMKTAQDVYKGYIDYTRGLPKGSDPSAFFTSRNSPYQGIYDNYSSYYEQLVKNYRPGVK